MDQFLDQINHYLWSYILIIGLLGLGIFFTWKTKFVQFRFFREMFRLLGENEGREKGITPFQAFCMSTASRVGTGNIAGVAIAIAVGGPGAVFWMWVVALIGAASGFIESTLAQIFKVRDRHGFRGGPAYYMEKGLNQRWMGVTFAVLITISFGFVFNAVQANTITLAFDSAYGIGRIYMGIFLAIVAGITIFGGVHRIAKVTEWIFPIMALGYVLLSVIIMIKNFSAIPGVVKLVFEHAFGLREVAGGTFAGTVQMGIKRGLFSNEAGMGSGANAAATAVVSHPVKQGLIQTLGIFTDTLFVCSATAFMILLADLNGASNITGIELSQLALSFHIGEWGSGFLAIIIFFFAFGAIVNNYYYGQTNIEFITLNKKVLLSYRFIVVMMILLGAIAKVHLVWSLADLFMGLMALLNLIAITRLRTHAFSALSDYISQKNQGKNPEFKPSQKLEGWHL